MTRDSSDEGDRDLDCSKERALDGVDITMSGLSERMVLQS